MTDAYLTAEQVASILGLSTYTVRAYARKGILPAYKVGNSWRFSRASLKEWVESDRKHEPFIVRDAVKISVYDASYVVLAERHRCVLYTADQKMVNAILPYSDRVRLISDYGL